MSRLEKDLLLSVSDFASIRIRVASKQRQTEETVFSYAREGNFFSERREKKRK